MNSLFYYSFITIETNIGTADDSTTPFIKDTIAVSGFVDFDIRGSDVSIDVAPAGAILSRSPMYLAIKGIVSNAIISLATLDINASALNSAE